jgi:hypothetical protein
MSKNRIYSKLKKLTVSSESQTLLEIAVFSFKFIKNQTLLKLIENQKLLAYSKVRLNLPMQVIDFTPVNRPSKKCPLLFFRKSFMLLWPCSF